MQRDDADLAFARYQKSGRPVDLARVFERCAPQLLLLAQHVAGRPGVAEDLVHSTFLVAIEAAGRFDSSRPVMPWLVGILVREARKHRRDAARTPDPGRVGARREALPPEIAEARELQEELARALDQLPQAYREVLTLRLIHGLTPTQIAHLRRASPQTIKTQLRRGGERLRARLPVGLATSIGAWLSAAPTLESVREVVLAAAARAAPLTPTVPASAPAVEVTVRTPATPALRQAWGARPRAGRYLVAATVLAVGAAAWLATSTGDGDEQPARPTVAIAPDPPAPRTPLRTPATVPDRPDTDAPPAPDPASVSFRGRLLDHRGWALPGARVELLRLHADALVVPLASLPEWTTAPTLVAGALATDVDGHFAIEDVTPGGTFALRVDTGGDRDEWILIDRTPAPHDDVDLGDVRLGRPRVLRGRIVDAAGRPIEGARLRRVGPDWSPSRDSGLGLVGVALGHVEDAEFEPDGAIAVRCQRSWQVLTVPAWARSLYARLAGRIVTTGPDGRFEWMTTRAGTVELDVYKPGFERVRLRRRVPRDVLDLDDVALDAGRELECTVADALGNPVAGAEVLLGTRAVGATSATMRPGGETDELGVVEVPCEGVGPVFLAVRRGPGEPWFVTDPMASDRRQRVRLPPTYPVSVRFVDRSGRAIPDASVRLIPGEMSNGAEPAFGFLTLHQLGCIEPLDIAARVHRPEPGVVHVDDVPRGEWVLMGTAPDHAAAAVALPVAGRVDRLIELAELEPVALAIGDVGFRAQPHLPVVVRELGGHDSVLEFPALAGRTDAEGALSIARRRWGRLAASAVQPELGWHHVNAAPGTEQMALTVLKRGVLAGQLTEAGEVPEPGSWILCATRVRAHDAPAPAITAPPVLCPTGPGGSFRFDSMEPGRFMVRAVRRPLRLDAPGYLLSLLFWNAGAGPVGHVEVLPGGYSELRLEALSPVLAGGPATVDEPASRTVHGTLRVGGRAGTGYRVMTGRDGTWRSHAVDASGAFDCGFESAGPVRIAVVEPRGADEAGPVAPLGDGPAQYLWMREHRFESDSIPRVEIDLDVQPMTCTVSSRHGARAGGIAIELRGELAGPVDGGKPATSLLRIRADRGGWFEIPDLPSGRYTMRAADPEHGWLEQRDLLVGPTRVTIGMSIELEPLLHVQGHADTDRIGIDLPQGSRIELLRRDEDGPPLRRVARFGRGGRFRVGGLLPGTYAVTIDAALVVVRGGRPILVMPEQAKIRVPQGEIRVVDASLDGVVLVRPAR